MLRDRRNCYGLLIPEEGTDRLSRNDSKKLPLLST